MNFEQLTLNFDFVPDVFCNVDIQEIVSRIQQRFNVLLTREDSWDCRKRYVYRKGKKLLEVCKGSFGAHTYNGVSYVHVGFEDSKNLSGSASPCKDWDEVFKEVERVLAHMGVK